jgi:hypothetical protein
MKDRGLLMFKKFLSLCLIIVLSLTLVVGCGGKQGTNSANQNS